MLSDRFRQPAARPNLVMVVLDDLGFADLGCFGSEISTPNIDALAGQGVRYNGFHVTALCSPTRACLLTGRNHHAVGMGVIPELATEAPGYRCHTPRSAATLPRVLRDVGYSTMAVGKWHLTPQSERSAAGPFDHWPLGMGFDRFYGFLGGVTSQWTPDLVRDNAMVEPPLSPEGGYHLTEDLASQAIRFVQDQQQAAPRRPFFLYLATGAVHYPHQVPEQWITPHRHRYDDGWERLRQERFARQQELGVVPAGSTLTPRPPWVTPWEDLSVRERQLHARQMEVYAGFLSHTDAQIGRVLGFLDRVGSLDETIVMVLSDNGASGEGGPKGWTNPSGFGRTEGDGASLEARLGRIDELGGFRTYDMYSWGWAWAGNTPFKLWKRYTWLGGVRVPLIVRWERGFSPRDRGEVRSQFCHAIDLMPTVLEAVGIDPPDELDGVTQQAVDGRSILSTFGDSSAPSPRSTQYFEVFGSRAIYHDGWKATTDHVDRAFGAERDLVPGSLDIGSDTWSLFDLTSDFSEAHNLAEAHPERLRRMVDLWWEEAERNQVLPLRDGAGAEEGRPGTGGREEGPEVEAMVLWPGGGPVSTYPLVDGFLLTADVEIVAEQDGAGVICAQGDWHGGWACYLLGGRVVAVFALGATTSWVRGPSAIGPGAHRIELLYLPGPAGGVATVAVDGRELATGPVSGARHHLEALGYYGRLLVGRDQGFPVCEEYEPPFPFTGTLHRVRFTVAPYGKAGAGGIGTFL